MKNIIIAFILIIINILNIKAQDISGQWNGLLSVQGTNLRLIFNITKTEQGYSSTMDSPDQRANGIPTSSTTFENGKLKIEIAKLRFEYNGTLQGSEIIGTLTQGGQSFPINLSREKIEKKVTIRPQEPQKPYPYYSENVTFDNKTDNITLSGTLTLPSKEGKFPVVILISGSGPQNRDEELLGHKPFLILADHLTKNGIGVLRYDDRGVADSKGDFATASSEDFAKDATAAVAYLKSRKEIDSKKIGLIGHSEGGIIAPMVASKSKDVAFIILLAGTGIAGDELLLLQQTLIGRATGMSEEDLTKANAINKGAFEIITKSKADEDIKTKLSNYLQKKFETLPESEKPKDISEEDFVNQQVAQLNSPWMKFFVRYNPFNTLKKVKCRVLALNGSKDLQVPAQVNLAAIKKALEKGKNKNVTILELPNLNHLFQECETGSPEEYEKIEQTFSPKALDEISNWIKKQVK